MLTLVIAAVIGGGLLIFALPYLGPVGRKLWFGQWEIDQTGQPRKVIYRDHHGVLVEGGEHHERRASAALQRKSRRVDLLIAIIMFAIGAATWLHFYQHPAPFIAAKPGTLRYFMALLVTGMALLVCGVFVFSGLTYIIKNGFLELLYTRGFQHMQGAKVLDPMPRPPDGPEKVREENIYGGEAHPTPHEVAGALGGGNAGNPGIRFKD